MVERRRVLAWATTAGLLALAALGVAAVVGTGGSPVYAVGGALCLGLVAVASWRSGARFEADAHAGRPLSVEESPAVWRALLAVRGETGQPMPAVAAVRMDVPGVIVGYSDGERLVAVDPRLPSVVDDAGLRALFAHEFGHFGTDIHTDALREYLPQTLGFCALWLVALAGRGPLVATAGTVAYLALAPRREPWALAVRGAASVGVEPLALAASRYANRQEEFLADAYAARVAGPEALTDALFRIAAVATGDNDEDVTGPVPWRADRSPVLSAFATHPSIERRAEALGCAVPAWVARYRPGSDAPRASR
jgi:Zn-dependent protease with chaperone function